MKRNYSCICTTLLIAIITIAGLGLTQGCVRYPNTDVFVNVQWLKALIDSNNNGNPFVIIEAGWGGPEASYDLGHIPGAIHVNTDEIEYDILAESSTTAAQDSCKGLNPGDELPRNWWNIYPDEYLLASFACMGIDKDTTVIVYGPDISGAARVVWALMYAGAKDVHLLEGSYETWTAAGYNGSTQTTEPTPVADFGATQALNPLYVKSTGYVRSVVEGSHPNALIVDIRTLDEYEGKTAPYGYIPTDGRITGAVWGRSGTTPWDMDEYMNDDGSFKSLSEIEEMWKQLGITRDKEVIFYCGTGWRVSLTWLFAYAMGWENISLYDGGWYEWSMGPDADINPVEDDYPDLP